MINKSKKFVIRLVILVLASIIVVWSISFIVDPYGRNNKFIFKGNKVKLVRDERIRKFDLLEKNPAASSFIFGSSRGLLLDAEKLGKLSKAEALNLAFSSASANEYYLFVKYLFETRKVSNIIIGIDLFAYTKNFISNGVMPPKLLSYLEMNDGHSMKSYLSLKMFKHSIGTLRRNYYDESKSIAAYTPRGKIINEGYLKAKTNSAEFKKYIKKYVIEDNIHWGSKTSELSMKQLDYLLKIKQLCDKNNVKLHIFMSPLYIKQIKMKNNRFKQQQKLLSFIVNNISPVMDFNKITELNTDPFYFLDSFHYSYDVGDMIIETFFSNKENQEKFLVTKANLVSYIESVDKNLLTK